MNEDFLRELKYKGRENDNKALKEFRIGWISFDELKEKLFSNNRMSKHVKEVTTDAEILDWIRMLGWCDVQD